MAIQNGYRRYVSMCVPFLFVALSYFSANYAYAATLNEHVGGLVVSDGWSVLGLGGVGGLTAAWVNLMQTSYITHPFKMMALDIIAGILAGIIMYLIANAMKLPTEITVGLIASAGYGGKIAIQKLAPLQYQKVIGQFKEEV